MRKKQDWQYMPVEVDENTTREELVKALQESATEMNSTVVDNGDGTFTFTTPDGHNMIVQIG